MRFLFSPLLLLALPAAAQLPVCNAYREGMAICFESRLCLCRQERGGQLTGRPEGFRWDCGPLRPDCRERAEPVPPWPPGIPPPQLFMDGPSRRFPSPR
ncbi:hypothetical protein [Sabulicella glaciei]|uniref:Secreted protein n=1 Tax=Sabulicella glaciei TaxID=2984948 RepID=A0ABT3NV99_9PROT|nr:hypothetical protein [Roseococcus sp. MDT2-1-1]MCW8086069.1 hypothetical protein [Roseococcus sp. MDT2-1-1]